MNKKIIKRFDAKRDILLQVFKSKHPKDYKEIVVELVKAITSDDDYDEDGLNPDPERITVVDHGDYQGSLLFIIAAKGYQPSNYWATECNYGSCSGCDTLQSICNYDDCQPSDEQANDYLTLSLHLAQKMTKLFEDQSSKEAP